MKTVKVGGVSSVTLKYVGSVPLLMHNGQLSDPLNAYARRLKKLTSVKNKTEEQHEAIAKAEFMGSIYWSEGNGPYLPAEGILAGLVDAGKLAKKGESIKRGVRILEDEIRLDYQGPRDLDELWGGGSSMFVDRRGVSAQGGRKGGRTVRTRPIFHEWSVTFTLHVLESVISVDDVIDRARVGGQLLGIFDYRPRFGRYEVEIVG